MNQIQTYVVNKLYDDGISKEAFIEMLQCISNSTSDTLIDRVLTLLIDSNRSNSSDNATKIALLSIPDSLKLRTLKALKEVCNHLALSAAKELVDTSPTFAQIKFRNTASYLNSAIEEADKEVAKFITFI